MYIGENMRTHSLICSLMLFRILNILLDTLLLFVRQMPEEDAFSVLVKLMHDYRLRDLFKPHMTELSLCIYKMDFLIQVSHMFHQNTDR